MDMTRNRALALIAVALGVTAAGVSFVLRGGFGLGFFLALAAMEAALFLYLGNETGERLSELPSAHRDARRLLLYALAAVILLLAATFVIFASEPLMGLNLLALLILYPVQLMLASGSSPFDWDHPAFWLESGLSYIVRPLISLGALPRIASRAFKTDRPASGAEGSPQRTGWLVHAGMALTGLVLAIPVLLVASFLLSSADSVFSGLLESFVRFWQTITLRNWAVNVALTLALFPFVFSFLESARSRWKAVGGPEATPSAAGTRLPRRFALNPVMLASFLASINLLYMAFALVQLTYLTGAFSLSLPSGMDYAEYARSGFFELAAMAILNLALIVLAVKGAPRTGTSGRLLRIMSLLLVGGSLIQWGSAMFRMNMYVSAYGLTRLRFFVTAFMLLMAVIFGFLAIKEFRPRFPLFKSAAVAAVLALLLLNYVNSDAWIARHNLNRSIADPTRTLDVANFRVLSTDASVQLLDRLPQLQPTQQAEAAEFLYRRLESLEAQAVRQRWQDFNWSQTRARMRLAAARSSLEAEWKGTDGRQGSR